MLARTDIIQLVGRHVTLKKAGTLYKGLCPFHDEKTPSFTVSPTRNTYHCFGCGAHGHAIRFLMEVGARNFPEAVRELAQECGVEVPQSRPESPAEKEERTRKKTLTRRLLDIQDALTSFYSDALFGPRGQVARTYLANRGVSVRAAHAFRLGWATNDKTAFARFLDEKQISLEDCITLGLVMEPKTGWNGAQPLRGGYLRFRERLMFPVVDFRGDVTGYSGRILDDQVKAAKYMNSPETPIFTKGDQLYGAFTARGAARKAGRVIVVEGNVDVIALWEKGLEGTVAPMGTALTTNQTRLIKRLSQQVVCIMDGDAAGEKAAFASLTPFLEVGIQPRAVMLPQGSDPDSFIGQRGVQAFQDMIDGSSPLMDLFITKSQASHPADAPGKLAALRAVAPAVSQLTDALALDVYIARLVTELDLSEDIVRRALEEATRAPKSVAKPTPAEPRFNSVEYMPPDVGPPEFAQNPPYMGPNLADEYPQTPVHAPTFFVSGYLEQMLVFIMQYPELVVPMEARGGHKYLTQPDLIAFFHSLYRDVNAGKMPNVDRILANLNSTEVVGFLRGLQSRPPSVEADRVQEAFEDAMIRLERGALEDERRTLSIEIREAFGVDPDRCAELNEKLNSIRARLNGLGARDTEGAG